MLDFPCHSPMIGIIYNSGIDEAWGLASRLIKDLKLEGKSWVCTSWDLNPDLPEAKDTELLITVGGDGTIIRAARLAVPHCIPILGINLGRLGFMTELEAKDAVDRVPQYLEGAARVEERHMIRVSVFSGGLGPTQQSIPIQDEPSCDALNDVVVGRGAVARLVSISTSIDGAHLTEFRADAVIVSTATGSTGYNLSVGGPILAPEAEEIILKPVAPHIGMASALVLPSTCTIELVAETDHQATLSVDGFVDMDLAPGTGVRVQKSPHTARFLRANPATYFYKTLTRRLGFGEGKTSTRAIQY
jgi:NAD+ kinase